MRLAAALSAALVLAACSGTSSSNTAKSPSTVPSASSPAAPPLRVTVLQQRVDATTRMVGVDTTNRGTSPVHVSAVRLSGGGIQSPVTPKDTVLQPRLTVALRISYGRPHCDGRSAPLTAHLKVDGRWFDYPVNPAGQREVRRLLDTDCTALALAHTASIRLAGPYRTTSVGGTPYLRGRLIMQRRSPGVVDLRSLVGTVLVDLRPVKDLVDLPATAGRAVTPILLGSTGRCDPHGLGQSTQTFLLSAYVQRSGDPEQRVVLVPPKPVQNRILQVIDRACGTSG